MGVFFYEATWPLRRWWPVTGIAALAFPTSVWAAPPGAANGLVIPGLTPGGTSLPWNIVVLLTLLTLLPAVLLAMTPFVRLLVVFHFLRQALGTQSTPTNQTLIGLALFLTYFIMQPVGVDIYQSAVVPLQNNQISTMEALDRGAVPVRRFMLKFARQKDLALFVELAKEPARAARKTSPCAS